MHKNVSKVIIESHYFPCIEFFASIKNFDHIFIETNEHYIKQSYRNRCYILGANKVLLLSVPIHRGSGKMPTKEVKIDYSKDWVRYHCKAIQSAYGNSPFYEFFADSFYKILNKEFEFLIELNMEILTYCLKYLGLTDKTVAFSELYEKEMKKSISDYRNSISLRTNQRNFEHKPYEQVFGKNFVPNLSVLDLLFCVGPNALNVINNSHFLRKGKNMKYT